MVLFTEWPLKFVSLDGVQLPLGKTGYRATYEACGSLGIYADQHECTGGFITAKTFCPEVLWLHGSCNLTLVEWL